jgi:hypothetical protein
MKRYYGLILFFAVTGLASCLKQNPALDPKQTNNILEIYNEVPTPTTSDATAVYPLYVESFDLKPAIEYKIRVSYSGADVAPEDITVNMGLNAQAINDYNDENGTTYSLIPATVYTVDSWTVIIPKGQRIGTMTFTLKTNQFDLSKSYALPLTILSASMGNISKNFGTVLFGLVAKNKYDGAYKLKGTFLRTDVPAYTGPFAIEAEMHTTGPNSVAMYIPDFGGYYQPFANNGSLTAFSNVAPNTFFNVTTDVVSSITDYTGVLPMTPFPGANSRYDVTGASPVIYLKYYYNTDPTNRIFTDTLVYTGPR